MTLEERYPWPTRAFFALAGLIPLLAPYELWRGLWPPTWLTPLFAIIVLGALSITVTCLFAAVFGFESRWTLGSGRLLLQRRSWFHRVRRVVQAGDVVDAAVKRYDWSDGGPSFGVTLVLGSGERLESPSTKSETVAQQFRDAVATRTTAAA